MNTVLTSDIKEVINALHYRPAVSILIPFAAKISLEKELRQTFKIVADKVEVELKKDYPDDICEQLMKKLRSLIEGIAIDHQKKSIAIFVSLVFQKVLFLDVVVQERIIIDESFEIRDLIYDKKQADRYLVLMLSGKQSRMYKGDNAEFTRIAAQIPENINAYVNEWPEKVANFTDAGDRKEIVTDKFLHHIGTELEHVIKEYQLPVFVLGVTKILGHFKKLTKHEAAISAYIEGNYEELSFPKLYEVLKPHLDIWRHEKQEKIIDLLDEADGKHRLVAGVKAVWEAVSNNMGHRLFVESDYIFSAQHGSNESAIEELTKPYNEFSYIRDAVDDMIEKVLANGGDVEFAEHDVLKEYEHIALLTY